MVSLLKRNNCQKTLYHSRILMECFGGNAASDEYPIARIAANAHVVSTYEGEFPRLLELSAFNERVLTGRADPPVRHAISLSTGTYDVHVRLAGTGLSKFPTMTQLTSL